MAADPSQETQAFHPFPKEEPVTKVAVPGSETPTISPLVFGDAPEHANLPGYDILAELGRGGMGVVYKARNRRLNRVVALKVLLSGGHAGPMELERFRVEAEAVARLQHPNIVQIHEVGEQGGLPFISLEYCPGGSLEKKWGGTPVPPRQAAELVETLALAIHAAHQHQIVHRDLKPANVLLGSEGQPKVTDFGLAKRLDEAGQTQSGSIMGTPAYMAPEQARGETKTIGPAADVYALGTILYECLIGRPPFRAATPLDTIFQVLNDDPVPPRQLNSKLPRDLETVCLRCLRKEPAQRYPTAQALAEDLRRFLGGEPVAARPLSLPGRLYRWGRRSPARAALLAVSVLGLLTFIGSGIWVNRKLGRELERTEQARHDEKAAQQRLQTALTRQVADRLDSDLRQLAAIPQTFAALLMRWPDWNEAQLEACLRDTLQHESRLFGVCVALEPYRFDPAREHFALYVYRTPQGLARKDLVPAAKYLPVYREWAWYREARNNRQARWGEPYIDKGGGDVPMVTYSVPLMRGGKFEGVVTADLSIAYFERLRDYLNELALGEGSYGFVVSASGTFLSHPDPSCRMPRKLSDVAKDAEEWAPLIEQMARGENGSNVATDFTTGTSARFLFAPVRASGWTFTAVIPWHPR